jgi:tyrosyl-tRNA synthetase
MVSGLELIRKVHGKNIDVGVLTLNLLTDENGQKIGKTQGKPI